MTHGLAQRRVEHRRGRNGVRSRWRSDAGAGGVLALAVVAVTVTVSLTVVSLGAALAARQRVVAAADASALAAADALLGAVPGVPCELAARVAAAHGTELASCRVEGAQARTAVRAGILGVTVTVVARAGAPP